MISRRVLQTLMVAASIAGATQAQTNVPAGVHSVSEHWTTAGNPYRLKGQVYFNNNSTLTIDAGVIVASLFADQGSLAICRGSQVFVNGTAANPVIMTTTRDVHTWTGTVDTGQDDPNQIPGDPKTGTWRATSNEWGNLTCMGRAYISANNHGGATTNVPTFSANNTNTMEGLTNGPSTDLYGGGNDDDNSGSIVYLSLRYGGKVVGLGNELNGMSMGGIGRMTTVHHIDIMNCIDDTIETWGGTVNYRYTNFWNYGDDGFDTDEGWRGRAQFGLAVAGYNLGGPAGSGQSDHGFEMDGAEDSDWQPVSTNSIYNFTCVQQPASTRGLTAWRDNNRTQYHSCIFMDSGGEVVKFDNSDGDGAHGYGYNGTLSWAATWTTPYNAVPPTPNDPTPPYSLWYPVQVQGFLAEIRDSVFFRNQAANAYTEATARGVFNASENNVIIPGISDANSPIQLLVRSGPVVIGGYNEFPVISLDPRPANEALRNLDPDSTDPYFTPAHYRGAFPPNEPLWIKGWTAADAYGFLANAGSNNTMTSFCAAGVAGVAACPCGNPQSPALSLRGCDNSDATGGAQLSAVGASLLSADGVVFTSSFEKPSATTIFLQGTDTVTFGTTFGQGVRCVGGALKRLYVHNASGGVVTAPVGADASVSARSAALGDTILPGQVRYYMAYYRDATVLGGCPALSTFNGTQAGVVIWQP